MISVYRLSCLRRVSRLALVGAAAGLLAGCADSDRLSNPFSNPFGSDHMATGSIVRRVKPHYAPIHHAAIHYARPIISHQLAPPQAAAYAAPYTSAPAHAIASMAPKVPLAGYAGAAGIAVVAGSGDSASVLARRYNLPEATLLRANGFTSAAQIQPGTRLIIPYQQQHAGLSAPAYHAPVQHMAMLRREAHPAQGLRLPLASQKAGGVTWSRDNLAPRSLNQQAAHTPHLPMAAMAGVGAVGVGAGALALTRMHDLAEIKKYKAEAAAAQKALADARMAQQAQKGHAPSRLALAKSAKAVANAKKAKELADARNAKVMAEQKKLALLQKHEAELHAKKLADARQAKALEGTRQYQAKLAKAKPLQADKDEAAHAATRKLAMAKPAAAPATTPAGQRIDTKTPTGSIAMSWPVRGRIIRGFQPGVNDGINISVPNGTPVRAIDGGVVAYAGSQLKGYGNLVLIRHPNGFVSAYADNGALNVKRGQSVSRGEVIAHSGQTGDVSSPQLHFELRKGTVPVNPTHFLAGT